MRRRLLYLTVTLFAAACLSGCQQKDPEPGDIAGYDEGERAEGAGYRRSYPGSN